MAIEDIAKRVIDNRELKTVLSNYIMYGVLNPIGDEALVPYENLVQFQELESEGEIEKAGYQLGEPWAGDIRNAPLLFVSRTLAYVANEICPRYIPNDSPDGYEIACTDKIFQHGRLIDGDMENEDVITWCNGRFNKAALKGNSLYITTNEGLKVVDYWGALRNNFEFLLPDDFKLTLRQQYADTIPTGGYARAIMKYVACTSVVPFKVVPAKSSRYRKDFIQGKTFEHCWEAFAEEIISWSGAKVIVLVSEEVLSAFEASDTFADKRLRAKEDSTMDKKGKKDIIKLYEWKDRLIVSVGINQGGMRSFSKYFQENSKIIEILRAKVKDLIEAQ